MANIIVAFSKPEDGKSIKGILVRSGYEVAAVCMSGSQVLSAAEDLSGGIVVCGYAAAPAPSCPAYLTGYVPLTA